VSSTEDDAQRLKNRCNFASAAYAVVTGDARVAARLCGHGRLGIMHSKGSYDAVAGDFADYGDDIREALRILKEAGDQ